MTNALHPVDRRVSRCAWTAAVSLTDNEPPPDIQGMNCIPETMALCENPDGCSSYVRAQTLVEFILPVIVETGWKQWLMIVEEKYGMLKLQQR